MGLFGSLFTGVSALFGQSQNTAIISNNIANITTTGYKRSEAAFQSLVTAQGGTSAYSPGTVTVNRLQRVSQQGALQQTASTTDAAVSGNGFFAVRDGVDTDTDFLYTRAGQFREDAQGLLRNAAGFVLYAFPIDADGNLPANSGDLSSLVPADVQFLGGLTRPTSSAELAFNLDQTVVDSTLSNADTGPADFTRGLTVYDSLGAPQVLTFQFRKTYGPQATAGGTRNDLTATDHLVDDLGLTDGDQFTLTDEGAPTGTGVTRTYDINTASGGDVTVTTIQDIIDDVNNNFTGISAFLGNDGELVIQRDEFNNPGAPESLTLTDVGAGSALTGLGLPVGTQNTTDLTAPAASGETYNNGDPTDSPPYSTGDYPAFQFLPGDSQYNSRGWYQMDILKPDGTTESRGLLNFNGDGSLNAIPDADGNIDINLTQIDFGNGSNPQNIDIDIERFSQFAGDFNVIFTDQNGAELGLRTGVDITQDGRIVARFSNGASADLYQIPLITFANPNGLTERSGTAFSESDASGEENLRLPGEGGAGFIEPSSLEASNVDLADEFARLIVSQRAFGAGTRLINTVDQMTQDLLSLR